MAKSPFSKEVYQKNALVYKILANSKRLEILNTIKYKEATVGELQEILKCAKANVSQHLALLRHARLVTTRRDGTTIYYKILDPRIIEPCRTLKILRDQKKIF